MAKKKLNPNYTRKNKKKRRFDPEKKTEQVKFKDQLSAIETKILFLIEENPNLVKNPNQIITDIKDDSGYGPPLTQVTEIIDYYNSLHPKHEIETIKKPGSKMFVPTQINPSRGKEIEHKNINIDELIPTLSGKKQEIVSALYDAIQLGQEFENDEKVFQLLVKENVYDEEKFTAFYQMKRLLKKQGIIFDYKNSKIYNYTNTGYKEPDFPKASEIAALYLSNPDKYSYSIMLIEELKKKFKAFNKDELMNLIESYNNSEKSEDKKIQLKRGRLPNKYKLELESQDQSQQIKPEKVNLEKKID